MNCRRVEYHIKLTRPQGPQALPSAGPAAMYGTTKILCIQIAKMHIDQKQM